MTTFASIVDWNALLETVIASVVAGLGIVTAFSIAIYGAARFAEGRRVGAPFEAGVAATLTVLALLVCAGAIVAGIVAMASE
jgi:hypothetical protein